MNNNEVEQIVIAIFGEPSNELIWKFGSREKVIEAWSKTLAVKAIEKLLVGAEKAFGGCKICYGKGYATTIEGTKTIRGNNNDWRTHIKYCSCERGKQLAQLKQDIKP
jgi:hypothetical protein